MTFLPIVGRELRVEARRNGTYWLRFFVGIQAILVAVVAWILQALNSKVKFGTALFWGLAGVALIHCLLAGRRSTADCLSQEKREGTMGLLFLTDLNGFDVVVGKLVATSLGGFYGLLTIFPVLAVPLLVGGMTSGELWQDVARADRHFYFYSLDWSFLFGGEQGIQRSDWPEISLVLTTLTIILPMIGLAVYLPRATFVPGFFLTCPFYAFGMCEDANYMAHPNDYWSSLALMHGLSWLFVMRACRLLPISWQDQPSAARAFCVVESLQTSHQLWGAAGPKRLP